MTQDKPCRLCLFKIWRSVEVFFLLFVMSHSKNPTWPVFLQIKATNTGCYWSSCIVNNKIDKAATESRKDGFDNLSSVVENNFFKPEWFFPEYPVWLSLLSRLKEKGWIFNQNERRFDETWSGVVQIDGRSLMVNVTNEPEARST